jgi:aryl-phospho-beta-D-glucosidase BglC (GH1 family)
VPRLVRAQAGISQGNATLTKLRAAVMLHRNTFITEADFDTMATLGINAVRLPIGYWVVAQTQVIPLFP